MTAAETTTATEAQRRYDAASLAAADARSEAAGLKLRLDAARREACRLKKAEDAARHVLMGIEHDEARRAATREARLAATRQALAASDAWIAERRREEAGR